MSQKFYLFIPTICRFLFSKKFFQKNFKSFLKLSNFSFSFRNYNNFTEFNDFLIYLISKNLLLPVIWIGYNNQVFSHEFIKKIFLAFRDFRDLSFFNNLIRYRLNILKKLCQV